MLFELSTCVRLSGCYEFVVTSIGARSNMAAQKSDKRETISYFFTIIGWSMTILGLTASGYITPAFGTRAMIAMVILIALASKLRMSVAKFILGIALPSAAVAFFVVRESQGDSQAMASMGGVIVALLVALLGLFVIVRGVFR